MKEVECDWLSWMMQDHIPSVMQSKCFESSRISRMVYPKDDDGATFTVQYLCENRANLDKYNELYATALQKEHSEKFKDKYVAFRSIMEVEDEFI